MVIYKIKNLITGKLYIGKSVNKSASYFGSGVAIKAAIKKYGQDNFVKEIVEVCGSQLKLCRREKFWIRFLNTKAPFGYNLTDGGEGLINPSDEIKRKMSEKVLRAYKEGRIGPWNKGRFWSEDERKRISDGTRIGMNNLTLRKQLSDSARKRTINRKWSDVSKQKQSVLMLGRPKSKEHCEKLSQSGIMFYQAGGVPWNKGRIGVYSDETRKCISNSLIGHGVSEKTRLKISYSKLGKPLSDIHKLHIKESWILRRN